MIRMEVQKQLSDLSPEHCHIEVTELSNVDMFPLMPYLYSPLLCPFIPTHTGYP
jgi:hypothetical protein